MGIPYCQKADDMACMGSIHYCYCHTRSTHDGIALYGLARNDMDGEYSSPIWATMVALLRSIYIQFSIYFSSTYKAFPWQWNILFNNYYYVCHCEHMLE